MQDVNNMYNPVRNDVQRGVVIHLVVHVHMVGLKHFVVCGETNYFENVFLIIL